MNLKVKYLSRINDEFDTVICGVNGVIMHGEDVYKESIDALIKLYQSGKKVMLASNSGWRVKDLYYILKRKNVPMNIFYAMITAGEVAHFYLKNNKNLGHSYYNLTGKNLFVMPELDYSAPPVWLWQILLLPRMIIKARKMRIIPPFWNKL